MSTLRFCLDGVKTIEEFPYSFQFHWYNEFLTFEQRLNKNKIQVAVSYIYTVPSNYHIPAEINLTSSLSPEEMRKIAYRELHELVPTLSFIVYPQTKTTTSCEGVQ